MPTPAPKKGRLYHVRLVREGHPYPYTLSSPFDAAAFFRQKIGPDLQERFCVLYLDCRHQPLSWREISRGSLDAALVGAREVFAPALHLCAKSVLVCHNHPSGSPIPSQEDRDLTQQLVRAGELLGIPVLDHVVVTADASFSFREQGWI